MKVDPLHGPDSNWFELAPPDACRATRSADGAAAASEANKSAANVFMSENESERQ
jgi:hypothetical protein